MSKTKNRTMWSQIEEEFEKELGWLVDIEGTDQRERVKSFLIEKLIEIVGRVRLDFVPNPDDCCKNCSIENSGWRKAEENLEQKKKEIIKELEK